MALSRGSSGSTKSKRKRSQWKKDMVRRVANQQISSQSSQHLEQQPPQQHQEQQPPQQHQQQQPPPQNAASKPNDAQPSQSFLGNAPWSEINAQGNGISGVSASSRGKSTSTSSVAAGSRHGGRQKKRRPGRNRPARSSSDERSRSRELRGRGANGDADEQDNHQRRRRRNIKEAVARNKQEAVAAAPRRSKRIAAMQSAAPDQKSEESEQEQPEEQPKDQNDLQLVQDFWNEDPSAEDEAKADKGEESAVDEEVAVNGNVGADEEGAVNGNVGADDEAVVREEGAINVGNVGADDEAVPRAEGASEADNDIPARIVEANDEEIIGPVKCLCFIQNMYKVYITLTYYLVRIFRNFLETMIQMMMGYFG